MFEMNAPITDEEVHEANFATDTLCDLCVTQTPCDTCPVTMLRNIIAATPREDAADIFEDEE